MLTLDVRLTEGFDAEKNEFVSVDVFRLELEHSLSSLSKWESKWEKAFMSKESKSTEELLSYLQMMTLTPNVPNEIYALLSPSNIEDINSYIGSKQTATWFNDLFDRPSNETVTSELIYYWMIAHNIPFECQYWHLNRLMTLIRVCNKKNAPAKKRSPHEMAVQRAELNRARREQLNTSG